jgi:hypothetical protein
MKLSIKKVIPALLTASVLFVTPVSAVSPHSQSIEITYNSPLISSVGLYKGNIHFAMDWEYDLNTPSQEAYGYIDVWIDGINYDTTSDTDSGSSVSITHNESPSNGWEFEGVFYGQTSTPAITYWSHNSRTYDRRIAKNGLTIQDAVKIFTDEVLGDFGYSISDYTMFPAGSDELPEEVNYYYFFEMEKERGMTKPSIYKDNHTNKYLFVYQDANDNNTIMTLDCNSRGGEPSISIEQMEGEDVSFVEMLNSMED